jgi:hypothetical protein
MQIPCNIVSNHEEHLSQKGEKKNRKEIKKIALHSERFPYLDPCYILIQQNKKFALRLKVHKHKSISTVLSMSLWIIKLNV